MANRWVDRGDVRNDRDYQDRDRNIVRRAGDEVRSWFGDDEAARRRRMDELHEERPERDWRDRAAGSIERGWDRTREAARHATDRDRDWRRGVAEWTDEDRGWESPREASFYGGGAPWRDRDPDYGSREGSSRPGATDPYAAPGWSRPLRERRPDWQRGRYFGRGPRGYRRGDERIREDVCDRLTEDARIDASDVEVHVSNGEVTLAGSVRTREEKRYTEDVVEDVLGVREVNNNLKVRPVDEVLGTARSGASTLGLTETPPPPPEPAGRK